jgi:micrococcal nuclease
MGNKLSHLTADDVDFMTFDGVTKKCKVVDVYDGDTCTIVFKFRGVYNKYKLRLSGIDAPEMKPLRSKERREIEIQKAHAARDQLAARILNKVVKVVFEHEDKYGRLLGTIYLKKENICEWMIENKLAVSYDGGKKADVNWEKYGVEDNLPTLPPASSS